MLTAQTVVVEAYLAVAWNMHELQLDWGRGSYAPPPTMITVTSSAAYVCTAVVQPGTRAGLTEAAEGGGGGGRGGRGCWLHRGPMVREGGREGELKVRSGRGGRSLHTASQLIRSILLQNQFTTSCLHTFLREHSCKKYALKSRQHCKRPKVQPCISLLYSTVRSCTAVRLSLWHQTDSCVMFQHDEGDYTGPNMTRGTTQGLSLRGGLHRA